LAGSSRDPGVGTGTPVVYDFITSKKLQRAFTYYAHINPHSCPEKSMKILAPNDEDEGFKSLIQIHIDGKCTTLYLKAVSGLIFSLTSTITVFSVLLSLYNILLHIT
jgi:hypothetical protein